MLSTDVINKNCEKFSTEPVVWILEVNSKRYGHLFIKNNGLALR